MIGNMWIFRKQPVHDEGIFTFFGKKPVHAQILDIWPNPHSWEELARVINRPKDFRRCVQQFEIAQMTRQLSGSGRYICNAAAFIDVRILTL